MDALFAPHEVTWRVNREAVLLAGGARALLLQVAHPLVAAGVERHSRYATDPWGRLHGTLDLTTRIVFGAPPDAGRARGTLRGLHAPVEGVTDEGLRYSARDPALLTWVWATLVDTALLVFQRSVAPLEPGERDRYVREQHRFAHACGVPRDHPLPPDEAGLRTYVDAVVRDEARIGDDARKVLRSITHPRAPGPLLPLTPPLRLSTRLLASAYLPPALRDAYALRWSRADALALAVLERSLRAALPLAPAVVRVFPAARTAERRAEGTAGTPPGRRGARGPRGPRGWRRGRREPPSPSTSSRSSSGGWAAHQTR